MRKILETILIFAQSVKAELIYDLKFTLNANEFYRAEFDAERAEQRKLCKILYK